MTVHAHCSERIRLLREAIERAMRLHEVTPVAYQHLESALLADDDLAATPPPDLPLAEGSEWSVSGDGSIIDGSANRVRLGSWFGKPSRVDCSSVDDAQPTSPCLPDVLALARREGLV